ncbi:MAG: VanZ family protein, partial [Lachnospiraceae bacterium]|nr:VanZ family protein [Lachnospiraceae bacterium]
MNKRRMFIKMIWWIYMALLLTVVIIKFTGSFRALGDRIAATAYGTNCNLIPFRSIGEQIQHISEGWAKFNLVGNIVPFMPFGFLLPMAETRVKSLKSVLK